MPNDENKIEKLNVVVLRRISRNIFYKFVYYFIVAAQPVTQKQIYEFEYWCTSPHVSPMRQNDFMRFCDTCRSKRLHAVVFSCYPAVLHRMLLLLLLLLMQWPLPSPFSIPFSIFVNHLRTYSILAKCLDVDCGHCGRSSKPTI